MTETVEVSGSASAIDVRSSATDTSVSNNMLQMTPLYSSTSTGLLNAAPGINSSSAYGGQGTTATRCCSTASIRAIPKAARRGPSSTRT